MIILTPENRRLATRILISLAQLEGLSFRHLAKLSDKHNEQIRQYHDTLHTICLSNTNIVNSPHPEDHAHHSIALMTQKEPVFSSIDELEYLRFTMCEVHDLALPRTWSELDDELDAIIHDLTRLHFNQQVQRSSDIHVLLPKPPPDPEPTPSA
jgi:hypothetical protein